ncbi:MAG: tetratricopeptide repeat protein [Candidatus Solibacter usitatus]|nr:tetratricopeptide repeat protein [Candidatus Solibacter usitatus]
MKLAASLLLLASGLFAQSTAQSAVQRAEALWKQRQYKDANAAFRQAVKDQPGDAALRVRWGLLLLERFNSGDAADLFNEALKLRKDYPPALLGLARVHAEDFDRRALDFTRKALEADPNLVEARELLAHLLLEDGDFEAAVGEADRIPASRQALAARATIELLHDRDASAWLSKMGDDSAAYARIARHFVLNRRYEEAIGFYRKAVAMDPLNLSAQSELGINLMRTGQDQEARRVLEAAHNAGFTDKPTSNSLRLLDSYKNFIVYTHPRYVLRLHKDEAELLRPYVEREMESALAVYDRKYGFQLPGPVTVEMYPDHEDFAVRTMGMPGLGALGVTFGLSIAMDSPSARKPGSFHWAGTLWHELSHAYVVSATRHRVPRWFTEGVSVFEETATRPEWREPITPEIAAALKRKLLLPISKLDRGFIRPSYPSQVAVSYFQAGRICDFIHERWGWPKLLSMMKNFSRVTATSSVIEKELALKPEEFDAQFLEWFGRQKLVEGKPDHDPALVMKRAAELISKGDRAGAEKALSALLWVYPVKDEELHRRLAALRGELGMWEGAAEEWRSVLALKTADPASAHFELARAYNELKRLDEAREAVLAALEIAPGYRPAQRLLLELNKPREERKR